MSGMIIQLRKKLKAANAEIGWLKCQNAQEFLDLAGGDPAVAGSMVIVALKEHLAGLGEKVHEHDTIQSKIANIVAAKNSAMQTMRELTKTPASVTLKDALRIIIGYRLNDLSDATRHVDADVFLQKSIVKAMLREIDAEREVK